MLKKTLSLLLFTLIIGWVAVAGAENDSDETVRISATDATSGKLQDKLAEGSGINIDNLITGANEKLTISTQDELSTKGDLLSHDGTGDSTLAVGTNGQVLVVDSATANGIKWDDAIDLSSPGPIGDTTPSTGDFTDLTFEDLIHKNGSATVKKVVFAIAFQNQAGTLKHRSQAVGSPRSSQQGTVKWPTGITGLSGTYASTPIVNSTTDFVSGVGIDSTNKNTLVFDWTVAQDDGGLTYIVPKIIFMNSGTVYRVGSTLITTNVNGSTKYRMAVQLTRADNGALTNWDSVLATNNEAVIFVEGWAKF